MFVDRCHRLDGRLGDEVGVLGGGQQPEGAVVVLLDTVDGFQRLQSGLVQAVPLAVDRLAEFLFGEFLGGQQREAVGVGLLDGGPRGSLEPAVGLVEAVGRPTAGTGVAETRHGWLFAAGEL